MPKTPKISANQTIGYPLRKSVPPIAEEGPFSGAISADEFMKHIKAIQQSNKQSDVELRNAAKNYMNNLRCV
jgi:hypothetical protein